MEFEAEPTENVNFADGIVLPFIVPPQFWEEQQSHIIAQISGGLTAKLPLELPYQVPLNYFKDLEDAILMGIGNQETIPSFGLEVGLPFKKPSLGELEIAILNATNTKEVKQVNLFGRKQFWYYSAAASVVIAMILGILITKPFEQKQVLVNASLQDISKEALVDYLAAMPVQNSDLLEITTDENLNTVLDEISTETLSNPTETDLDNYNLNIYDDEILLQ
jgi:hypothetical protein